MLPPASPVLPPAGAARLANGTNAARVPFRQLTAAEAARHRAELERLLARGSTPRSPAAAGGVGLELHGFNTVVLAQKGSGSDVQTRCVGSVAEGMEFLTPTAAGAALPTE
jgi:hypothetical protein